MKPVKTINHFLINAKYDGEIPVSEILKRAQNSLEKIGLKVDYSKMYFAEDWDNFVENLKDENVYNFSENIIRWTSDYKIEEGLYNEDIRNIYVSLNDNPKKFAITAENNLGIKTDWGSYKKMALLQKMINQILNGLYDEN